MVNCARQVLWSSLWWNFLSVHPGFKMWQNIHTWRWISWNEFSSRWGRWEANGGSRSLASQDVVEDSIWAKSVIVSWWSSLSVWMQLSFWTKLHFAGEGKSVGWWPVLVLVESEVGTSFDLSRDRWSDHRESVQILSKLSGWSCQ